MGNLRSNHSELFDNKPIKAGPECGSTILDMERCINGNTICQSCKHKDKHKCFYYNKFTKEDNIKEDIWVDKYDDKKYIREEDDIIEARGGDGTLLKAIKMHRDKGKPFFGIAGGTENFLMNKEDYVVKSHATYKEFHLIKVKVTYQKFRDEITEEFQAFNDVIFGGDMNSWIDFNVQDKDQIIGSFKGGGVIVSTAQGSTGINKNNNGVILPLSSKNWSITGDKTNRKINYIIEPKKTKITCKSRIPATLWIDGANNVIENVKSIEISKGDKVIVIFNSYEKIKKKRRI